MTADVFPAWQPVRVAVAGVTRNDTPDGAPGPDGPIAGVGNRQTAIGTD